MSQEGRRPLMQAYSLIPFLAAATLCVWAPPAQASGMPPLGLKQGHGSLGMGFMQFAGDIAIFNGLTVGVNGWSVLVAGTTSARVSYTLANNRRWGSFGLIAAVGQEQGWSHGSAAENLHWAFGPMYESGPGLVKLRAQLLPAWRMVGSNPGILIIPNLELVVPVGDYVELTVGGNSALGLYLRW